MPLPAIVDPANLAPASNSAVDASNAVLNASNPASLNPAALIPALSNPASNPAALMNVVANPGAAGTVLPGSNNPGGFAPGVLATTGSAGAAGGNPSGGSSLGLPSQVTVNLGGANPRDRMVTVLKILGVMTILTLAPSILVMMTSFTRIVVVLSFVRRALSLQDVPPTQVIIGLSLFLTFFTMAPTWNRVWRDALQPYMADKMSEEEAFQRGMAPIREFMFKHTRKDELRLFVNVAKLPRPSVRDDVPSYVLLPAFMMSEVKTSFVIGFLIFIPFLVIDMVVASILLAMGMMMLPPVIVSLPFKIILFVLVDGWSLIIASLIQSYS